MRKKIGTVGYSADRQAGVQPDEVSYATTINALTKARSLNPSFLAGSQAYCGRSRESIRELRFKHLSIWMHLVGFCLVISP